VLRESVFEVVLDPAGQPAGVAGLGRGAVLQVVTATAHRAIVAREAVANRGFRGGTG
jgi:hypothetical protein